MRRIDASAEKRMMNEAYALKYKARDRNSRRSRRRARIVAREERWLQVMGIPRNPSVPVA